jgi:hypothetical protein
MDGERRGERRGKRTGQDDAWPRRIEMERLKVR